MSKSKTEETLELVVIDSAKVNLTRYQKDETAIAKQKKAIEDLVKIIDDTPRTPSNAFVLGAYAKTLTTLKNKIDKQRKTLKESLNKEGEAVHDFYNATFIKPLEAKINSLKKDVANLTQPLEVEVVNEKDQSVELPINTIQVECDVVTLTKILSFLQSLNVKFNVV